MMNKRRFRVEELETGYLLTISQISFDDKVTGRHAFLSITDLFTFMMKELNPHDVQD